MTKILIVAPDGRSAQALAEAYRGDPGIVVRPWNSLMGHRPDRVMVLPFVPSSPAEAEAFARAYREAILTKVPQGGKLIEL